MRSSEENKEVRSFNRYSETVAPLTGGSEWLRYVTFQRKHLLIGVIRKRMQTSLKGIAKKAKEDKNCKFRRVCFPCDVKKSLFSITIAHEVVLWIWLIFYAIFDFNIGFIIKSSWVQTEYLLFFFTSIDMIYRIKREFSLFFLSCKSMLILYYFPFTLMLNSPIHIDIQDKKKRFYL